MKPIREVLNNVFDQLEAVIERSKNVSPGQVYVPGATTGFADLDYLTSGFQPCDLIVIGGAKSSGKTSLALQVAYSAAIGQSRKVGLFSPGTSAAQLFQRILSLETGIETHRLRSGQIGEAEWDRIALGFGTLSESTIFIDDTTTSISALRLQAQEGHEFDLIIIDDLQLLVDPRAENRSDEVSEIIRQLKALARKLRAPIVVVSQISDTVERRSSHRPILTDLKDSGSIENDADIILFIYREDMYEEYSEKKGIAEIIIAKHRNGPVGSINLRFFDRTARFADLVIPIRDNEHVDHV